MSTTIFQEDDESASLECEDVTVHVCLGKVTYLIWRVACRGAQIAAYSKQLIDAIAWSLMKWNALV